MMPPVKLAKVGVSYMIELLRRSWNRAARLLPIDWESTLLPETKLPLAMPNMLMVSPYSLYTVSMLPSLTVPKAPLLSPTNELREPKVPVPTSKLVACSSCQIALSPPKPRSPRKPMYELPTSMSWRGGASSTVGPAAMTPSGRAAVPVPVPESDETEAPGCVAPWLLNQPNCG